MHIIICQTSYVVLFWKIVKLLHTSVILLAAKFLSVA